MPAAAKQGTVALSMSRARRSLPPTFDIVLAVVFAALALAELEFEHPGGISTPTQVAFSLAIALPLAWRRTRPLQAAAVSLAAMAAGLLAGVPVTEGFVPLLIFGFAIYAIAPFYETFREMIEMRYLWQRDLELVNDKLVAFLGEEPHTRLETALTTTLRGMNALPTSALAFA